MKDSDVCLQRADGSFADILNVQQNSAQKRYSEQVTVLETCLQDLFRHENGRWNLPTSDSKQEYHLLVPPFLAAPHFPPAVWSYHRPKDGRSQLASQRKH